MRQIAIIGGGSWGTALSLALGRKGHPIRLWVFEKELVESINHERRNALYLSEFELPDCVSASHSLEAVLDGADIVLTVVPSHHCRAVYQSMLPLLHPEMVLVSATKGIETESLMRMSEVISAVTAPVFQAKSCSHLRPVVCKGGCQGGSDRNCRRQRGSRDGSVDPAGIFESFLEVVHQYRRSWSGTGWGGEECHCHRRRCLFRPGVWVQFAGGSCNQGLV